MADNALADAINNLNATNREILNHLRGGSRNVSEPRQPENFPGYSYLQRVSTAFTNAMAAMTENYNENWGRMKAGSFTFGDYMKSLAIACDTYYDVGAEAFKGPSAADRVEWVHFTWDQKKGTPDTLKTPPVDLGRKCSLDAELDWTPMANFGGGSNLDLIQSCEWTDALRRDQVEIVMDVNKIKAQAQPGHYIGFVLERGNTGVPPLVAVMLHVT
jgi:hypothetical protein